MGGHCCETRRRKIDKEERNGLPLCTSPLPFLHPIPETNTQTQSGKSLLYIFAPITLLPDLQTSFKTLAKHYAEYISFVVIDAKEYGNMLPQMGLAGRELPCAALYNTQAGQVFRFEGEEVDVKGVDGFIGGIVSGSVKPLGVEEQGGGGEGHEHDHDEL